MENRRQNREQAAVRQRSAVASSNPTDVLIWHEVSQHLDDAVLRLSLADRKMILLRFYEQHALPEIAAELGLTENAARQRLSRALRKLRDRLTKKSALASALDCGAFAGLLGEQLIRAAPPAIGKAACAAAAGAGAGTGFTLAKGAMHMMTLAKTKVAVAAVAVVTLTGIGGMMAIRSAPAQDQPAAAPAPPPAPAAASDDPFSLVNAPPVVVKTVPESGIDDVDPGLTEIRVTYSKEMKDGSWSWSTWGEKTFPKLSGKPHYLDGKRTCVLPVKLEPNKTYATWLNSDRFLGFKDAGGRPAVPYLLIFKTRP